MFFFFCMFRGRMGRSYIVDEAVEEYLGGLQAAPGSCVTGLLAGQVRKLNSFIYNNNNVSTHNYFS